MIRKLQLLAYLFRYFGAGWMSYRAAYHLARRSGILAIREKFLETSSSNRGFLKAITRFKSAEDYSEYRRCKAPDFFFRPTDRAIYQALFAQWDKQQKGPFIKVQRIREGFLTYFEHTEAKAGFPPEWHRNPFNGIVAPSELHWSRINEGALGDVKVIWEPSRFAWVYSLVRNYWRTGIEEDAELFWRLVEDWDAVNPPCKGVNWRCSQEIGIRVMALCFGLYGFLSSGATTPDRLELLVKIIWVSGHRIALDLPHAISQKNNHGMTAASALMTIGVLFPEFRESGKWLNRGLQVLESLGRNLIYEDGAFVQHSLNYHRLMLHDYIWAMTLGRRSGISFSKELESRIRGAAGLLWQMQDETSGSVPQYGQFDGSLILPLNNCDYLDFRPVMQLAGYLLDGTRWCPDGPWDEDVLWLFGPDALTSSLKPPQRRDFAAGTGGYYVFRGSETFLMTRCANFRHRPAQPDMLHVDIWWKGNNVAIDPGTFSYGDGGTACQQLVRTGAHNTVEVDGQDQMEQFSKFLWFPWPTGRVLRYASSNSKRLTYWEGEHDGYARIGVRHRRAIISLDRARWIIIDRLEARKEHIYRLNWHFSDVPYLWDPKRRCLSLDYANGQFAVQISSHGEISDAGVRRAASDGTGWRSRYYYTREPSLLLSAAVDAKNETFASFFGPAPASIQWQSGVIEATGDAWRASIEVGWDPGASIASHIRLLGESADELGVH